jgi:hypothetical protein
MSTPNRRIRFFLPQRSVLTDSVDFGIRFASYDVKFTWTSVQGDKFMQDQTGETASQKQERREYFRVDDFLPLTIKKIDEDPAKMRGKTIPGLQSSVGWPTSAEEIAEEGINPVIWRMLTEINQKLTVLLDNMYLGSQGLTNNIPIRKVCVSASGIKATCEEKFVEGDSVEIKMLLTANTSFWVVIYGKVIRTTRVDESKWEIAIEFSEMGDEVKNAIGAYMISRQREMIRRCE